MADRFSYKMKEMKRSQWKHFAGSKVETFDPCEWEETRSRDIGGECIPAKIDTMYDQVDTRRFCSLRSMLLLFSIFHIGRALGVSGRGLLSLLMAH